MAIQWVKANRQATWLGALLLLCILVFLAALLFRRRKNAAKTKRAGTTLAQPKHSADVALNNPAAHVVNAPPSNTASRDSVSEDTARHGAREVSPSAVPVASANASRTSGIQENAERGRLAPEQAKARSAGASAPQNQATVPASSSTGSPKDEDQEREVFEL